MEQAGKILALISAIFAVVGLLLAAYITVATVIYRRQLKRLENSGESKEKSQKPQKPFAFDWEYDDFERRFSLIFNIPSIALLILCSASVVTAIAAMIMA